MNPELLHVSTGPHLDEVRKLFREYAESLGFGVCFQSFDKELKDLPGEYSLPGGRLVLARLGDQPAGCVAMRPIEPHVCEIKRLFVRPAFRGRSVGLHMTQHVLREARQAGYAVVRLDTIVGTMDKAIELYRSLGFKEIPTYYANPIPGALHMELRLRASHLD